MKITVLSALLVSIMLFSSGGLARAGKPASLDAADEMARQAQGLIAQGKTLDARTAYQRLMAEHPDYKNIEQVQKELYDLNMRLLFSDIQTPQTMIHEVQIGDTLGNISKKYNVTMDLIKTSNGMKTDTVRVGQHLRLWKEKFVVLISKSQNTLTLKSGDDVLKVYSVATGANNSTPVGTFKVVTKLENPVWYKTDAVIPPESPKNVLGTRWIGLDIKGYGIHGTVEPEKMGHQVTSGCIRMRNEEVEELYKVVPRGTEVTIVN